MGFDWISLQLILVAAHIAWAMARDGCLLFFGFLYKLSEEKTIATSCLIALPVSKTTYEYINC